MRWKDRNGKVLEALRISQTLIHSLDVEGQQVSNRSGLKTKKLLVDVWRTSFPPRYPAESLLHRLNLEEEEPPTLYGHGAKKSLF